MRGTRKIFSAARNGLRFIPAYAGNALLDTLDTTSHPVHPRVCGERQNSAWHWPELKGSSPRMRGTLARRPERAMNHRFIPAYAGNARDMERLLKAIASVHPRVCGER